MMQNLCFSLLFYILLENISLKFGRHHSRIRNVKCIISYGTRSIKKKLTRYKTMNPLSDYVKNLWSLAGRELYLATPAVK